MITDAKAAADEAQSYRPDGVLDRGVTDQGAFAAALAAMEGGPNATIEIPRPGKPSMVRESVRSVVTCAQELKPQRSVAMQGWKTKG